MFDKAAAEARGRELLSSGDKTLQRFGFFILMYLTPPYGDAIETSVDAAQIRGHIGALCLELGVAFPAEEISAMAERLAERPPQSDSVEQKVTKLLRIAEMVTRLSSSTVQEIVGSLADLRVKREQKQTPVMSKFPSVAHIETALLLSGIPGEVAAIFAPIIARKDANAAKRDLLASITKAEIDLEQLKSRAQRTIAGLTVFIELYLKEDAP
jgi:hypothetical protein